MARLAKFGIGDVRALASTEECEGKESFRATLLLTKRMDALGIAEQIQLRELCLPKDMFTDAARELLTPPILTAILTGTVRSLTGEKDRHVTVMRAALRGYWGNRQYELLTGSRRCSHTDPLLQACFRWWTREVSSYGYTSAAMYSGGEIVVHHKSHKHFRLDRLPSGGISHTIFQQNPDVSGHLIRYMDVWSNCMFDNYAFEVVTGHAFPLTEEESSDSDYEVLSATPDGGLFVNGAYPVKSNDNMAADVVEPAQPVWG